MATAAARARRAEQTQWRAEAERAKPTPLLRRPLRLAEDKAESARRDLAQADRQGADLRDQVGELRAKLATMSAQRDAAIHDAEREKAHGHQRVVDLRARHKQENCRRREEFAELT